MSKLQQAPPSQEPLSQEDVKNMRQELLRQKALIGQQQEMISQLQASAIKIPTKDLELKASQTFLQAIHQIGNKTLLLKKKLHPDQEQMLFILDKKSMIHWNQKTGVVSLDKNARVSLEESHQTLLPSRLISELKGYIDDAVLGNWIADLDFSKIKIQEQHRLLGEICQLSSLQKLTIQNSEAVNGHWLNQIHHTCPSIKELTLLNCKELKIKYLDPLASSHKEMTLTLGESQWIQADEWNSLANQFHQFQVQIGRMRFPINQFKPNRLLYQAIMDCSDHIGLLKLALLRGAKINEICKDQGVFYGKNALHIAAASNLLSPLKFLVKNGGDLTIRDCKNRTPLDKASYLDSNNSHKQIIHYLLGKISK